MNTILQKVREKQIGRVLEVEIQRIVPNPDQPRKSFGREELVSLAKSIAQDGILQPLTVRRLSDGDFELVSGERRLRAAKMAGFRSVPCIEVELTQKASAVMSLVENLQREDLSFFEQARAIEKLIEEYAMTQESLAVRLGVSQSCVANKLRLLRLSDRCVCEIMRQNLSERHARALLKLPNEEQRLFVLSKIEERGLNVTKTEQLIEAILSNRRREESVRRRSAVLSDVRLFFNTVNRALEVMKLAGVNADARKVQGEDFIEYTIKIPLATSAHKG